MPSFFSIFMTWSAKLSSSFSWETMITLEKQLGDSSSWILSRRENLGMRCRAALTACQLEDEHQIVSPRDAEPSFSVGQIFDKRDFSA